MKIKMKRLLYCFLLLIACSSGTAHAAGQFDGIYLDDASQSLYLTLYQSKQTLITTIYSNSNVSGLFLGSSGGTIAPIMMDKFSVINGTIASDSNGFFAKISGYYDYRACSLSFTLNLYADGVDAVISSVSTTQEGIAQGYNCQATYPIGGVVSFTKIL